MKTLTELRDERAKFHKEESVDSAMDEKTAMYYGFLYGFDEGVDAQEQALQKKIDELEKNFEEVCMLLHNLIITTEGRKIYGDDFIDLEIKETKFDFRNILEAIDKGDVE